MSGQLKEVEEESTIWKKRFRESSDVVNQIQNDNVRGEERAELAPGEGTGAAEAAGGEGVRAVHPDGNDGEDHASAPGRKDLPPQADPWFPFALTTLPALRMLPPSSWPELQDKAPPPCPESPQKPMESLKVPLDKGLGRTGD